jgi:flagellin-specific chaperone FliS
MQNSIAVDVMSQEHPPELVGLVPGIEPSSPQPRKSASSTAAKAYRNEQLLNLTPVQVIEKLYSIAIQACKKNDKQLAKKAINELIAGLNFEHGDIAVGLYRLYEYCKHCIRKGNANEAVVVLDELRATWVKAFNL